MKSESHSKTFQVFLYRYTKQEDLILPLIGLNGNKTNPVILRVNLGEDLSYIDFLKHVQQTATEALERQDYSFQSKSLFGLIYHLQVHQAYLPFLEHSPWPHLENPF